MCGTVRTWPHPPFREILRLAPAGAVDPALDPDDVFDLLLGAILTRTFLANATARHTPVERTVELILRLLRPEAGADGGVSEVS